MTAQEVYNQVLIHETNIEYSKVFKELRNINSGAWSDVLDKEKCGNYQWLTAAMDFLKPKQVVELGGAMGVGTLCMISTLPNESTLWSITLEEHGLEFSYIDDEHKKKYLNMHLIIGDDTEIDNWGQMDLQQTDFWYFDSEHTYEQLHKETLIYGAYFKKGAIVCFDDTHMNDGMKKGWEETKSLFSSWCDTPLHYTGWGIGVI